MKKFFQYAGLLSLMVFSFYYTDKVTSLTNKEDIIMKKLNELDKEVNKECVEGYIKDGGIVLGISGLEVNIIDSYSKMKGIGYHKDLVVYKENKCKITKTNSIDKVIVKGNEKKRSVSIVVKIIDGSLLKDFVSYSEYKKVKISFVINGGELTKNLDYYKALTNNGYDILYDGNSISDLELYLENNKKETYCVFNNSRMFNNCIDKKINTIEVKKFYNTNTLFNINKSLNSGDFIGVLETKDNLLELSSIINYIKSKGFDIITISEHLK